MDAVNCFPGFDLMPDAMDVAQADRRSRRKMMDGG